MLTLRPATLADSTLLLEWRNDPLTRAMSISTDEVHLAAHEAWLARSLDNPDRSLLIAEHDGRPVATVRIDRGDETELSWTVAPIARGRGVGSAAVSTVAQPGMVARIKPENTASRRIAERAGFRFIERAGDLEVWRI